MVKFRTEEELDRYLKVFSRRIPLPPDFETECDNCKWFLENYERSDLYLFRSMYDRRLHILNDSRAKQKGGVT